MLGVEYRSTFHVLPIPGGNISPSGEHRHAGSGDGGGHAEMANGAHDPPPNADQVAPPSALSSTSLSLLAA